VLNPAGGGKDGHPTGASELFKVAECFTLLSPDQEKDVDRISGLNLTASDLARAFVHYVNLSNVAAALALESQRNPFPPIAIAIVEGSFGRHYASARHEEDEAKVIEHAGKVDVTLFHGEDENFWYCWCKSAYDVGGDSSAPATSTAD
jgi:hypothetical protein